MLITLISLIEGTCVSPRWHKSQHVTTILSIRPSSSLLWAFYRFLRNLWRSLMSFRFVYSRFSQWLRWKGINSVRLWRITTLFPETKNIYTSNVMCQLSSAVLKTVWTCFLSCLTPSLDIFRILQVFLSVWAAFKLNIMLCFVYSSWYVGETAAMSA